MDTSHRRGLLHPVSYPDDGGPVPVERGEVVPTSKVPNRERSDQTTQSIKSKIRYGSGSGRGIGAKRHEDTWNRTPNTPGTGAIHVRSFRTKLSDDALAYLDQQINEWLDEHPQYEVKLVTTAIGEWSTKLGKEAGLIVNVWV